MEVALKDQQVLVSHQNPQPRVVVPGREDPKPGYENQQGLWLSERASRVQGSSS